MNKGTNQSTYDLWNNDGATNNNDSCNKNPAALCRQNYKNGRVDTWKDITEVSKRIRLNNGLRKIIEAIPSQTIKHGYIRMCVSHLA